MKKFTILMVMLLLAGTVNQLKAQNLQDDIYIGIGASYGENIDVLGLNLNTAFAVTDILRVGADFIHFFTYDVTTDFGSFEQKMFEFNFNGHVFFINAENASVYALAGLQYVRLDNTLSNITPPELESRKSELGINIGGGLEFILESFGIFVEPKYTIGGSEQFYITAGFRFRL